MQALTHSPHWLQSAAAKIGAKAARAKMMVLNCILVDLGFVGLNGECQVLEVVINEKPMKLKPVIIEVKP